MSIKDRAASFVLGLMFVSLIVIYLITQQDPAVTAISVLLLALSLFVSLRGGWHELLVLAGLSALTSLAAVSLLGDARYGNVGAWVLPVLWGGVLLLIFNWAMRHIVQVPRDHAVLVERTFAGTMHMADLPVALPLTPLFGRKVAEIPTYALERLVRVERINTAAGHDVDAVTLKVIFRVVDPLQAYKGVPNRAQAQQEVARELGQRVDQARTNVTFWERLLGHQMEHAAAQAVRDVIFNDVPNAVGAYTSREQLEQVVQQRLADLVSSWGVQVAALEFERLEVSPERFRRMRFLEYRDRETEMKRVEAEREATRVRLIRLAEAEAESERVRWLVQAVRDSGVDLSPELLEEIVRNAIVASEEWGLDVDYEPLNEREVGAQSNANNRRI